MKESTKAPPLLFGVSFFGVTQQFSFYLWIMTQIMPRREKRLKKASKGCYSITQLFSLHQNNPVSSTSVVPPVNEATPENQ